MSGGHYHSNDASLTQNQGNHLGDRPCVRQSRLYREHVGGNEMKGILGHDALAWDTTKVQGVYDGQRVHGEASSCAPHANPNPAPAPRAPAPAPQQQQETRAHRRGAGEANRTTYNFMTGQ